MTTPLEKFAKSMHKNIPQMTNDEMDKCLADFRKKIKAQKAANTKVERDRETRRKILIGSMIQSWVSGGKKDWSQERLDAELREYLTRPDDRALFGLDAQTGVDQGETAVPDWDEQGRIYLVVPYNPTGPNPDKDEVKRLGATYDPARTAWYISKGADLEKFRKWFPSSRVNEAKDEDDLL